VQVSGNNAAVLVLQDETTTGGLNKTPIYRLFQNTSLTNNLYYLVGAANCDNVEQFHGILGPLQELDCSGHRSQVSIFAPAAYTAVATLMYRTDNEGDNIIGH
jgi:hypothetical protein